MDALLALREAIVHGAAITEQGGSILVHNGLGEPLLLSRAAKTPFKSSGGGHLTVEALYLQFLYKDLKHADFWKQYDARGLNKSLAVLVQDKEFVLQYLTGAYDGADHVDRDFVSTVSGVTRGASSTAAPSAPISTSDATEAAPAEADSGAALAAMLQETALRTRVTILDAPGFKNFSEFVFEFFKRQEIAPAGGSGASKPPAGSKRSREEKAAPAGSEARKQVDGMHARAAAAVQV